jgi:hypothetical protein
MMDPFGLGAVGETGGRSWLTGAGESVANILEEMEWHDRQQYLAPKAPVMDSLPFVGNFVNASSAAWRGDVSATDRYANALGGEGLATFLTAGMAKMIPVPAAEETAFSSTLNKVGTLDFSTPANGAVFYSGPGQGARAAAFAEQQAGRMTIEMTQGGQQLMADPVFQSLAPGQQYQVWQAASAPFAQGASGGVNAFISGARATGTFRTIEEPILTANPNVFTYTYHY